MTLDEALLIPYYDVSEANAQDRAMVRTEAVSLLVGMGFEELRAEALIDYNAQQLISISNVPLTLEQAQHVEAAATVIRFRRGEKTKFVKFPPIQETPVGLVTYIQEFVNNDQTHIQVYGYTLAVSDTVTFNGVPLTVSFIINVPNVGAVGIVSGVWTPAPVVDVDIVTVQSPPAPPPPPGDNPNG